MALKKSSNELKLPSEEERLGVKEAMLILEIKSKATFYKRIKDKDNPIPCGRRGKREIFFIRRDLLVWKSEQRQWRHIGPKKSASDQLPLPPEEERLAVRDAMQILGRRKTTVYQLMNRETNPLPHWRREQERFLTKKEILDWQKREEWIRYIGLGG